MSYGWIIVFDAAAGLVAFVCWNAVDVYRAGWGPWAAAFVSDRSYRRSIGIDLVASVGGGTFVGALTVAVCLLEGL